MNEWPKNESGDQQQESDAEKLKVAKEKMFVEIAAVEEVTPDQATKLRAFLADKPGDREIFESLKAMPEYQYVAYCFDAMFMDLCNHVMNDPDHGDFFCDVTEIFQKQYDEQIFGDLHSKEFGSYEEFKVGLDKLKGLIFFMQEKGILKGEKWQINEYAAQLFLNSLGELFDMFDIPMPARLKMLGVHKTAMKGVFSEPVTEKSKEKTECLVKKSFDRQFAELEAGGVHPEIARRKVATSVENLEKFFSSFRKDTPDFEGLVDGFFQQYPHPKKFFEEVL